MQEIRTDLEKVRGIVKLAQSGNENAKNELVKLLRDNRYMMTLSRYLHLNRLLEPEDVESEFWVGVIIALPICNPDIGDPLHFLKYRGICHVKKTLRSRIRKGVVMSCKECGNISSTYKTSIIITEGGETRKIWSYRCTVCHSPNVETWQRLTGIEMAKAPIDKRAERQREQMDIHLSITPQTLHLTTQEVKVYELILGGIDRDSSTNFLVEISNELNISPQCASQYLKKIRSKLGAFLQYDKRLF